MRNVLIDVDTQHDFCDPRGALYVRGSDALAPTFRALVSRAAETATPIVGSVDSHAFDAWEFEGAKNAGPNGERPSFPPHCVKGTTGWLKVDGTLPRESRFIPNVRVGESELRALLDGPQALMLEKEVYSLFANPNAEAVLRYVLNDHAPRFIVFGVATDYCVRAAVLGLLPLGEVWLVKDAIAAVDPANGASAIAECAEKGARLVSARDALGALS